MLQLVLCRDPVGRLSGAEGHYQEMTREDWGELLLPGEEPWRGCLSTETFYFSSQLAVGEFSHSFSFSLFLPLLPPPPPFLLTYYC